MSRRIVDFDDPDGFAARAVGQPGERTFFLQAEKGPQVVSVALEMEQVELLAERMLAVIDELERRGLAAIDAGPGPVAGSATKAEQLLEWPLEEEFHAGTLTIAWDEDVDRLIIEARSHTFDDGAGDSATPMLESIEDEDVPDDAPIGPDVLRVRLRPVMAQRFARQAGRLAAADRTDCPFCGEPLDPGGHLCPRPNGSDYVN